MHVPVMYCSRFVSVLVLNTTVFAMLVFVTMRKQFVLCS